MEWSHRNRSDEVNLTTNESDVEGYHHDLEPARFNTSRPLTPEMAMAVPLPVYLARNESEMSQKRRSLPMRGPMGGLPS
jgi:hypothetical protein